TNLAKGKYSFALGGHSSYHIQVFKIGTGSPNQISVDTNSTVIFNAPRGVAANSNPKDAHFGLIYTANSTPGSTPTNNFKARGLYIMAADTSDANGRGNTVSVP